MEEKRFFALQEALENAHRSLLVSIREDDCFLSKTLSTSTRCQTALAVLSYFTAQRDQQRSLSVLLTAIIPSLRQLPLPHTQVISSAEAVQILRGRIGAVNEDRKRDLQELLIQTIILLILETDYDEFFAEMLYQAHLLALPQGTCDGLQMPRF